MTVKKLEEIQENFILEWGTLGSKWGVNRTMAQIHALLMSVNEALTTDQIMERLSISRGNAHANIKELIDWGIVKRVNRKGERKELFVGEKEPWKLIGSVCAKRRQNEIEPTLQVLRECIESTKGMKDADAREFQKQMSELVEFLELGNKFFAKISSAEKSWALRMLLKVIS